VKADYKLTAGLNKPPLIRKKTHTVTARENPKAKEMYRSTSSCGQLLPFAVDEELVFAVDEESAIAVGELAICVPEKAKNRKRKVPTNSPIMSITLYRTRSGSQPRPGKWCGARCSASTVWGLVKDRTTGVAAGGLKLMI
jgi:hypothetical protein